MKSIPLHFHPEPGDGGGGKSDPRGRVVGTGTGANQPEDGNENKGGNAVGKRSARDPDRQQEIRQDLMPDLGEGGTPNPT